MTDQDVLLRFGVALVVGALIGVERERHFREADRSLFAGIRTFTIVSISGALCGYLSTVLNPWLVILGLLVAAMFSVMTYLAQARKFTDIPGTTTELAFVATYLIGVCVMLASMKIGIALGVSLAVLLSTKKQLRLFLDRTNRDDFYATLKFAIIAGVILPFLPRDPFDPFGVLSLYNAWLMVVLVSSISFSGFFAMKFLGERKGLGITALLGGLWSSTATTITFSQRANENPRNYDTYALGTLLACSTMFPRIILVAYVVESSVALRVAIPMAAMGIFGLAVAAIWYTRKNWGDSPEVTMTNPFSLRPAIKFGVLYSIVYVGSKAAQVYLGDRGLLIAALLTGLLDVNAITIAAANLVHDGAVSAKIATYAIVIAAFANTIAKATMTRIFGTRKMFWKTALWFGLTLVVGTVVLVVMIPFWR